MEIFVTRNTNNLFGMDTITKFNSWHLPISSFCNNIEEYKDDSQNIKEEIKKTFPEVFTEGLGRCTKMTAKIKLEKNVLYSHRQHHNDTIIKTDAMIMTDARRKTQEGGRKKDAERLL